MISESSYLRVTKKAIDLTLEQRTHEVIRNQQAIAKILDKYEWVISDPKGKYHKVDIFNLTDEAKEFIYREVKAGMNTGLTTRTRYKPGDTPDQQSAAYFLADRKSYFIHHNLGYYGNYNVQQHIFFNYVDLDKALYTAQNMKKLVEGIISFYGPEEVVISGDEKFRSMTRYYNPDVRTNIPAVGWLIYLSNEHKLDSSKIDFCSVTQLENGILIDTANGETFDSGNQRHVSNALLLEQWFIDNNIRNLYKPAEE